MITSQTTSIGNLDHGLYDSNAPCHDTGTHGKDLGQSELFGRTQDFVRLGPENRPNRRMPLNAKNANMVKEAVRNGCINDSVGVGYSGKTTRRGDDFGHRLL